MEFNEMEQLAFIVAKELGVDKPDVDLIKSIRQNRDAYSSALKQILIERSKAKVMSGIL